MDNSTNKLQKELISLIKEQWFSPRGLLALLIFELLILLPYFWVNFGTGLSLYEYVVLGLIAIISFFIWLITKKYPKNVKDKIGIVIAVVTENKKEYSQLKSDLVLRFKQSIETRNLGNFFNVIELPDYYASKIQDYPSSLMALEKTRAHFIVYGVCKKRLEGGKRHYFIISEATVIHKPIPKIISDKLSREFAELFPRSVRFPETNELSGFEITKEWMSFVARYIIGIAAFLSGDFTLSFNLFKELHDELKSTKIDIVQIKKLKTRMPQRISESALALLGRLYFVYRKTKNKSLLSEMKPFLDILKNIDPNNYPAHLLRGIYLFLVERNVKEALKEIKKSRNSLDATWRYSEAFLFAYEGNLNKAEKSYKRAFKSEVTSDIIFQTEEFIYNVLEIEPEKHQLWYCLGMINWQAKGDKILAGGAFGKFLNYGGNSVYSEQKRKVKQYLKQL